ncbi:hypothetical protein ATJ97_0513 [Georgenia soli]|uniref:Uncharacterized protein n=1 Tax=Georgenia soli TaxID=638953 RepID=A0A2A9EGJ1_9MICO|nr:hypothetical protein [Georgenia soli]PFG38044.1 hypothetical protein ATJ97_0513 [Georgenia soli]
MGNERDVPARVALFFGWAESPIWYRTAVDAGPVDLSTLSLSTGLRQRLNAWNTFAGRVLSAHNFEWPDARTAEKFTAVGSALARDLREELGIEVIYTPDGDVDMPMPSPSQLPDSRDTDGWYASAPLSGETFPPQRLPEPNDEE